MIKKIYVDMDGVLCDFNKRYREFYKVDPTPEPADGFHSETTRDKIHREQFNRFVRNKNFANLDPMPDIDLGLKLLKLMSISVPVQILSSTACEEYFNELSDQKKFWLNTHNINYTPIFVPGKRLKKQYSQPGHVLIDDTASNINDWNKMGGIGILHFSWEETINYLTKY